MDEDLSKTFVLVDNGSGDPVLSVHVKRSYDFEAAGGCHLSDIQSPLLDLGIHDGEYDEPDIILHKLGTDLIVHGSAYAPNGQPVRGMIAGIRCGEFERVFLVQGDRRCTVRSGGKLEFSEAEPFRVMPLCHTRTYGGSDLTVPVPESDELLDVMVPEACIYPRNPTGCGYAVTGEREHVDGLKLPNVENPSDPLTPERLVSGGPEHWWKQPLPWGCGPYAINWYPRSLYLGGVPRHMPEDEREIEEVRRGWVPRGQRMRFDQAGMAELFDPRCADAASPGMTLPVMRGDESITLSGMSEAGEAIVQLPRQQPDMLVKFFGRTYELAVALQRVIVDVDLRRFSLVWRGAWVAPKLWTSRACEVLVDGEPVQRLGASVGLSASRYSRKRY